jgi:hypothetical protein
MDVDNETPRVDNVKTKKNKRKFSTYQRHIIYNISSFNLKKEKKINII